MAVDFIVGKAFEALYAGVEEVIRNNLMFSDLCKDVKSTLDCLKPLINEMGEYNQQLHLTKDLEALEGLIKRGIELVGKCSKLRKWNFRNIYKKQKYTNDFLEFKESLQKELEVLKVQMARDVKKTEVAVENMARGVKKTEVATQNIEFVLQSIQTTVSMLLKKNGDSEIESVSAVLPELPAVVVGLDGPLEELKVELLKDEGSMLIMTAPGGCGKTTLAIQLCQDQDIKEKFQENIFFVSFTKKPNLERIMKGLYEQKGYKASTSQKEATPVKWLETVQMEKGNDPLLLVLDDVWSGSESLLEKFDFKMSNYKILVTSRSEFPRFSPSYLLQLLDFENAMQLFHHTASLGDKSSHIPGHLSKKIVKLCNGFPLTIIVVGNSLCGQPEEIWRSRVDEWSEDSSIVDLETDLLLQLQSSLDVLDNAMPKVKKCFLDLVAFPEDAEIQVTALFYMWAELYDLQKETSCIAKLYELNSRGLALLQKPEGDTHLEAEQGAIDYSAYVVRQRDLLRKLAIYNFRRDPLEDRESLIIEIHGNNFPKWWSEQTHPCMNARLVSISTDGEFSVKFPNMELPEAEVLVLNFQSNTTYALPKFIERMDKLKVLLVMNNSGRYIEMDNFQVLGSLSNLRSVRLDGVHFSCIAESQVQFKNLHKLYWRRAGRYDGEDPVIFSHVFPILEEMVIESGDFEECPAELCELIHLKKLEIIRCPRLSVLPNEIGNLVNLEVLRLEGEFSEVPDSIGNLKKLKVLFLTGCYWLPESIGNLVNLEELRIEELSGVSDSIGNLKRLKILISNSCDDFPESIGNLVSLEVLRLEDCTNLSEISDSIVNLKKLKFLKISNNKKFRKLPENLGKLKFLRHLIITSCYSLCSLPESIGNLVNLEVLILRNCIRLSELPVSIRNLHKLNFLDIHCCYKIKELPKRIRELKKTEVAADDIQTVVHEIRSMLVKQHEYPKTENIRRVLPELPGIVVGLETHLEELKVKLLKDDVSILFVTAPGGCGKTTLATLFCQDEDIKDKFQNNIFFVTFSKKPNLELIMKKLHEQKDYTVPTFLHEVTPEKWLKKVELEKGDDPLLLVLDDVWSGSEPLLQKFVFNMSNYKILVTSRSEFPRFGSSYHLPLLNNDNALKLFRHTASLRDKSSHIPEHLSKEIVKHCNGFPLTITMVGRSLCGQPVKMWQSRVDEWSEGSSILHLKADVLLQLQSSLDVLDDAALKVKNCFYDLGAFPQAAEIQVTALFYMWAELYDLKKETSCFAKLNELNNRGLAHLQKPEGDTCYEAVQQAKDYSTYMVRQHDLLRKLAIYNFKRDPVEDRERLIIEIRGNNFPKWWREQIHPYMKARLVSISTDEELSVTLPSMELPEAEVLVLNFRSKKSYALPEFVERMDKLKVLLVINYSSLCEELDNFQVLESLLNLRSLRLDRVNFSCITKREVRLKNLHKLYLRAGRYEGVDAWSYGDPVKFSHVFPNLKEMVIESCEFQEFPSELVHLTKLEIISCPSLSGLHEAIGSLVNLEVLKLGELLTVPDSIGNLQKLKILIINCCESCDALPDSVGNLTSLEVLMLEDCKDLSVIPDSIGNLKRLQFLKISNNKKLEKLPEEIGKLKCLRHLIIDRCYKLYDMPKSIGNLVNLEVLTLRYCYMLMELPESIRNLRKLNSLDIEGCWKFQELPEHIGELKSLRKLQMFSCNALRNLPASVSHLDKLEEVMCEDWHARVLWTPLLVLPTLKNLRIVVWKANIHGR